MNKLKLNLAILFAIIVGVTFIGCQKNEVKENLKPVSELSFKKLEDNPQTNNFKNTEGFVIVRIIIGRGSSCRPGLGACSASVLWWEVWHAKSMNNLEESDREICSPIVEENSINYVYLYFDEDVSNYSEDDLVFVLENELQAINEKDESVITLPVGTYYYNSSIGEFGGYKIALIKSSDYNVFC